MWLDVRRESEEDQQTGGAIRCMALERTQCLLENEPPTLADGGSWTARTSGTATQQVRHSAEVLPRTNLSVVSWLGLPRSSSPTDSPVAFSVYVCLYLSIYNSIARTPPIYHRTDQLDASRQGVEVTDEELDPTALTAGQTMDGESTIAQDARVKALWATLDTHNEGALSIEAFREGLQKLDHRT